MAAWKVGKCIITTAACFGVVWTFLTIRVCLSLSSTWIVGVFVIEVYCDTLKLHQALVTRSRYQMKVFASLSKFLRRQNVQQSSRIAVSTFFVWGNCKLLLGVCISNSCLGWHKSLLGTLIHIFEYFYITPSFHWAWNCMYVLHSGCNAVLFYPPPPLLIFLRSW